MDVASFCSKPHRLARHLVQNHCKMACFGAKKYPPYQISVLKKKWCRNQDSNSGPTDIKLNYGNFDMGPYSAVPGTYDPLKIWGVGVVLSGQLGSFFQYGLIPDCPSQRYYSLIKNFHMVIAP